MMLVKSFLFLFLIFNQENMFFITGEQDSDEWSPTLNSESFYEVMSKKVPEIASKMDLLLTESKLNVFRNQNCGLTTQDLFLTLVYKVMKLEDGIVETKSHLTCPKFGKNKGDSGTEASTIESRIESLQDSLSREASRRQDLEARLDRLVGLNVEPEAETPPGKLVSASQSVHSTCKTEDINIGHGHPSLLTHLSRINFNIFLRKPSNASSLANSVNHKIQYAVDGDFTTYHHSVQESNPWLVVDLEVPHLIWEIKIKIREVSRAGGTKIHVTNHVTFDSYGHPDLKSLPLFASQVGNSASTTMVYSHNGGICGRYVIVSREVKSEYLLLFEIQGVGYAFN